MFVFCFFMVGVILMLLIHNLERQVGNLHAKILQTNITTRTPTHKSWMQRSKLHCFLFLDLLIKIRITTYSY